MPMNWLQVLGTTETPHIAQGVRHQFHPVVALLDMLETEEEPLAFVLPRKRPLDALPSRMNRFIEPPRAPTLGPCAMAGIFLDGRKHPRIEDGLAIGGRIEATIEIEIRA